MKTKCMWMAAMLVGTMVACGTQEGSGGKGDDDDEICNDDGRCTGDEDEANCPSDCEPADACGNGTCEVGETPQSCAADCTCGNNVCDPNESQQTCAADCTPPPEVCGNNVCTAGETAQTCAADCTATLRMTNNSAYTMYYLYARLCTSTTWTANLIPTYVAIGSTFTLTGIPFDCWVFRAENSGHQYYWQTNNSNLTVANPPYTWTWN